MTLEEVKKAINNGDIHKVHIDYLLKHIEEADKVIQATEEMLGHLPSTSVCDFSDMGSYINITRNKVWRYNEFRTGKNTD